MTRIEAFILGALLMVTFNFVVQTEKQIQHQQALFTARLDGITEGAKQVALKCPKPNILDTLK